MQNRSGRGRQRGAALILLLTIIILGVAWFTVGALGKAAPSDADREVRTGLALQAAKQALLSHVAQYAARYDNDEPGQLPCPESVTLSSPGVASSSCSNVTATVGRLPWKTLGIDQLRDGWGEPLWYVLSPGFRSAPINFGTPAQLAYNGTANAAVALIIAPGRPLNTLANPATAPVGCTKVNQQVSTRNSASLNLANFLECGNTTGSYANPGTSDWSNDRVVSITAAEWADAIAGPVADRLQRQVAPAMNDWRATESVANWSTSFLPYASTFSDPATNDLCGDAGIFEGMPPSASASSGTCGNWTSGSMSSLTDPLLGTLFPIGCAPSSASMQCTFFGWMFVAGLFKVHVAVQASSLGGAFRGPVSAADIVVSPSGLSISNFSAAIDTTGTGNVSFDLSASLLSGFSFYTVTIPNPPNAAVLNDSRVAWFLSNGWDRYTYYAVSKAVTVNPGTATCPSGGGSDCLSLNAASDKKLVLALMGPRAVGTQTQPSGSAADYLESHTISPTNTTYSSQAVSASFNDRLAACPFSYTPASGTPITVCN